jgi:EAL domain-containing protein (putative c-di-GMP-specific phosphodiesterase class I)
MEERRRSLSVLRLRELRGSWALQIAIDDFGSVTPRWATSGQFSGSTILKGDKSVHRPHRRRGEKEFALAVRRVIDMAKVSPCVRSQRASSGQQQLDRLLELGCDSAQGYYFAKRFAERGRRPHRRRRRCLATGLFGDPKGHARRREAPLGRRQRARLDASRRGGAITERIERLKSLDPIADLLQRGVRAVVPPDTVIKDLLSGTWLGHPLHPPLTDVRRGRLGELVACAADATG